MRSRPSHTYTPTVAHAPRHLTAPGRRAQDGSAAEAGEEGADPASNSQSAPEGPAAAPSADCAVSRQVLIEAEALLVKIEEEIVAFRAVPRRTRPPAPPACPALCSPAHARPSRPAAPRGAPRVRAERSGGPLSVEHRRCSTATGCWRSAAP